MPTTNFSFVLVQSKRSSISLPLNAPIPGALVWLKRTKPWGQAYLIRFCMVHGLFRVIGHVLGGLLDCL